MSRTILTVSLAQKAVEMVLPAIKVLIENKTLKRGDLHIVIVDPGFTQSDVTIQGWDRSILCEYSLGDPSKWEHPYDQIARSKAEISWRHQMPTQVIQERCPHLLQKYDTVYFGSAVSDGLVVAVSGVQAYFDQMIAAWILEACRALCIEVVKTNQVKLDEKGNFIRSTGE